MYTGRTRINNASSEDLDLGFEYSGEMNQCKAKILANYLAGVDIKTSEFKSQMAAETWLGHRRFSSCRDSAEGLIDGTTALQLKNLETLKGQIKKLGWKVKAAKKLPEKETHHQYKIVSLAGDLHKLEAEKPESPKKIKSWQKKIDGLKLKVCKENLKLIDIHKRLTDPKENLNFYNLTHKLFRLGQKLENLEKDIAEKRVRIGLATKKLFRKQYNLKENGFETFLDFLDLWQFKRSCNAAINGSKDEVSGNQLMQATLQENGLYEIDIKLPPTLATEEKEIITLKDVDFSHGESIKDPGNFILQKALDNVQKRKRVKKQLESQAKEEKRDLSEDEKKLINSLGQPINYRVIFDRDKFKKFKKSNKLRLQVFFTTDVSEQTWKEFEERKNANKLQSLKLENVMPQIDTSSFIGPLTRQDFLKNPKNSKYYDPLIDGLVSYDFNDGFLSMTQLDRHGNLVDKKPVPFYAYGLSANQRKNKIHLAAKEVSLWARGKGIYLVVREEIDFQKLKLKLKEMSPKRARMLSAFPYAQMDAAILGRFYKDGVKEEEVGPEFTSFIGKLKYQNMYGITGHEAGGIVIGRRKYGFSERLPELSQISWATEVCEKRTIGTTCDLCSHLKSYVLPVRTRHRYGNDWCKVVYKGLQKAVAPQFLAKVNFRPSGRSVHRKVDIPCLCGGGSGEDLSP